MKISKAFGKAFRVCNGDRGAYVRFFLTELCLTLITLAPLLFLAESGLRPLALLCVPLFVFVLLPARVNAAAAMQNALAGGSLFSRCLADASGYGRKLGYGLLRAFYLLLWAAPLIAGLVIARAHISGEMDGFTLLRMIKSFGGEDLLRGTIYVALIFVALLLLFAAGCGFHCGDRHAMVLGLKKIPGGRRKMLGCWICSLVVLLPLIIAVIITLIRYFPALMDLNGVVMDLVELPSTRVTAIILGAGAVLTLPLMLLRSMVIAACAGGNGEAE